MKKRNHLYFAHKRRGYSTYSYTIPAYPSNESGIDWSEPAKSLMNNFAIMIPSGSVKMVKKKWTKKEIIFKINNPRAGTSYID